MEGGGSSSSSSRGPGCFSGFAQAVRSRCGCFGGSDGGTNSYGTATNLTQAEFEQLIVFLGAVPILRKHLPRAQLPKVAHAFKLTKWPAGSKVIEEGQVGNAFFIIKSGEAQVVLPGGMGVGQCLYALDYFGGQALLQRCQNFATIVARGPQPLVTLSMSRQDFQALGLGEFLKFPRRPAVYEGRDLRDAPLIDGRSTSMTEAMEQDPTPLTLKELDFLCVALRANPNLKRALGQVDQTIMKDLARLAQRHRAKVGAVIGTPGELPADVYIVGSGTFDIVYGAGSGHRSAEATLRRETLVQKRIRLKQEFVARMEAGTAGSKEGGLPSRASSVRQTVCTAHTTLATRLPTSPAAGLGIRARATSMFNAGKVEDSQVPSPFKVGDQVARVVVGSELAQEVGEVLRVVRLGRSGAVEVKFGNLTALEVVDVAQLRPARDMATMAKLTRGMAYGDVALLYNTRLTTTCRAAESSVVYVIRRSDFTEKLNSQSRQRSSSLEEHIKLLDDVHLLSPLVRSQRWEIARSAAGVYHFKAGDAVYEQGVEQQNAYLYVIKAGSAVCKKDGSKIATLRYAFYFGERMILRNEKVPEFSVLAGPEGLTCLAIHAETLRAFLAKDVEFNADMTDFGVPGVQTSDVLDYFRRMPKGLCDEADLPFASLEKLKLLGEGGFGAVFLVQAKETGQRYALKCVSKGHAVRAKATKQVCLERDILTLVDSSFIVKLFRTYKDREYVYLLLELCNGGLHELMTEARASGLDLPVSTVMFYSASCVVAIGHLHERHIAFRDLKAENVLVDSRGYAKLCDMGFAKFVVDKTHTLLGTPEYMAPEVIDPPHEHGVMVDWWALGVLTFELLTGQGCWYDSSETHDDPMSHILALRDNHDEGIPEGLIPPTQRSAKDFIKRLLCVNVRKRLGAKSGAAEVQSDRWFTSVGFDFGALRGGRLPPPQDAMARSAEMAFPATMKPVAPEQMQTDSALFAPILVDTTDWDAAF